MNSGNQRSWLRLLRALWLGGLALFSLGTTAQPATKLVLYTEQLPPYAYDDGQVMTGVAVEALRTLMQRAELQYEVQFFPWRRSYQMAMQGENRCVFPVQRSQQREASFYWISPLLVTRTVLYGQDAAISIQVLDDARPYSIGAFIGSATEAYLTEHGFNVFAAPREISNVRKLTSGRIQLWATDELMASYLLQQHAVKGVEAKLAYFTSLRGIACSLSTNPQVIERLQQALASLYADGSIQAIMLRYGSLF